MVWADAPVEHDYPAAAAYLGLLAGPDLVQVLTALLSQAPTVHHRANDLLRAARLPLLDGGNPEVAKDLKKIDAREALSPVLLIRGDLASGHPLQVADGYHRICASYAVDEDTFDEIGRAHGEVFGEIRPASAWIGVSHLGDPRWRVEIEADAVLGER